MGLMRDTPVALLCCLLAVAAYGVARHVLLCNQKLRLELFDLLRHKLNDVDFRMSRPHGLHWSRLPLDNCRLLAKVKYNLKHLHLLEAN